MTQCNKQRSARAPYWPADGVVVDVAPVDDVDADVDVDVDVGVGVEVGAVESCAGDRPCSCAAVMQVASRHSVFAASFLLLVSTILDTSERYAEKLDDRSDVVLSSLLTLVPIVLAPCCSWASEASVVVVYCLY